MTTLFLTQQGATVRTEEERIVVCEGKEKLLNIPAIHIDQIAVFGNINFTTPALNLLFSKHINTTFLTQHGSMKGTLQTDGFKNSFLKQKQYEMARNDKERMYLARQFIYGKIKNQFQILKRYPEVNGKSGDVISQLCELEQADNLETIRGIEGHTSQRYFQAITTLFDPIWEFQKRTKHPPEDPVNVLLSLGYTLLHSRIISLLQLAGLDPYCGFFHTDRNGHASLASDIIEEFRAVVVDSLVIQIIRQKIITRNDFNCRGDIPTLKQESLKVFLRRFEERIKKKMVVKIFNMSKNANPDIVTDDRTQDSNHLDYRGLIYSQIQNLKQYIAGNNNRYTPFLKQK